MNVLMFSDSHGAARYIDEIISRQTEKIDAIIFLGDGLRDLEHCDTGDVPIYSVRGNCDVGAFYEDDEMIFELGGIKIFIAHGHTYSVKSTYRIIAEKAARRGANIVMFGHTHIPLSLCFEAGEKIGETDIERDLYVFNPGSLREGRFGTMCIRSGKVLLNLAEL